MTSLSGGANWKVCPCLEDIVRCKGTLPLALRRRRAVDGERIVPGDGKEWCNGPAKTSSGGDTSEELDAAMGASENGWWRRPGGKCGRHGDGDVVLMFFVWQCVYDT